MTVVVSVREIPCVLIAFAFEFRKKVAPRQYSLTHLQDRFMMPMRVDEVLKYMFVVTIYCQKGELHDLCQNT